MRDPMPLLFDSDPYEDFDASGLAVDLQTWGGNRKAYRDMIDRVRPSLIVEVGSWKGGSAINMAKHVKAIGIDCKILCVDTWLGSLEHWLMKHSKVNHDWYTGLGIKNGRPGLYRVFMNNVIRAGVHDVVVPFPATSSMAFKWLDYFHFHPELIFLDGSHDEQDVLADLEAAYKIVPSGGCIFGDDWTWQSVRAAVEKFADVHGLVPEIIEEDGAIWILRKP